MSWQEALLDAASSVLVEVATGRRIKVGGCLPAQAPPPRADVYKAGRLDLPTKVDLRPYMTPVEDQSAVNSCASNAIIGIYEYLSKRAHGRSNDVSRLFVYYTAVSRSRTREAGPPASYRSHGSLPCGSD